MHGNIALFIPHLGCPHACSFCDQKSISGEEKPVTPEEVTKILTAAFEKQPDPETTEIAFFGGSFTCLPKEDMEGLLKAAYPFIKERRCFGIRVSTRPDGISEGILETLSRYGVTAIELGAQSLSDEVLLKNYRGHTAADVFEAAAAIRAYGGFSLGLQVMAGLYGDSHGTFQSTMEGVMRIRPDTVRIYPTVVLEGTELARLTREGLYTPLSVEEAVEWVAPWLPRLEEAGIRVIRVGLHPSETMERRLVGGAYHSAFRELCEGRLYWMKLEEKLRRFSVGTRLVGAVAPKELSKAIGQKKENLLKAKALGYPLRIRGKEGILPGEVEISVENPYNLK